MKKGKTPEERLKALCPHATGGKKGRRHFVVARFSSGNTAKPMALMWQKLHGYFAQHWRERFEDQPLML